MHIRVNGIVVGETIANESNRFINLLTDDKGLIKAFAKGVRGIRNKNSCAAQIFSYSQFIIYKGRGGYIIDESEVKEVFAGLRDNITKFSLAQYFCEIMMLMAPKEEKAVDFLKLLLNCLYYLENDIRDELIIKFVFEMRVCAMSGYMPDFVGCYNCGLYVDDNMYFSISDSVLICGDCYNNTKNNYSNLMKLERPILDALRYIIYSKPEKIFSFKLSEKFINKICNITENYLILHSYGNFKALQFYKSLNLKL